MSTCTIVGHNFCNPYGLLPSFLSTCEFWCIGTLVSTENLKKSCRTVAGCLAKQAKVSSSGQSTTHAMPSWRVKVSYEYLIKWCNCFKPGELSLSLCIYHRHIAKPSPFPVCNVVMESGLLPIFLHNCEKKSGSGLWTRLLAFCTFFRNNFVLPILARVCH